MFTEVRPLRIVNARIVTENGVIVNGSLLAENGHITEVLSEGHTGARYDVSSHAHMGLGPVETIDAQAGWVLPGFIDVHVHGGNGHDFMEANEAAYDKITEMHAIYGTTGILATTVTAPPESILQVLDAAEAYRTGQRTTGARLLGVHLEGPFINPRWSGAQNPSSIAEPSIRLLEEWCGRHPNLIKIITLAPELPGALEAVEWLSRNGIVPSCGHSDATYDTMQDAASHGLRHASHTFNAMRGLHHREPGTAGAVLTDDRLTAEVIADGHHVHPACISLLARMKGPDRLLLITDAMAAAGLGDGDFELGGLDVAVRDGVARLKGSGALAGSTLTMLDAFRYAVRKAGLDVAAASRMASSNPARLLGVDQETGSIAPGKRADLLLLTNALELVRVWCGGV